MDPGVKKNVARFSTGYKFYNQMCPFSIGFHVISDTGITVVIIGRQISAGPVMMLSA